MKCSLVQFVGRHNQKQRKNKQRLQACWREQRDLSIFIFSLLCCRNVSANTERSESLQHKPLYFFFGKYTPYNAPRWQFQWMWTTVAYFSSLWKTFPFICSMNFNLMIDRKNMQSFIWLYDFSNAPCWLELMEIFLVFCLAVTSNDS